MYTQLDSGNSSHLPFGFSIAIENLTSVYTQQGYIDSHAQIGTPRRIWTVPAIHGHIDELTRLHDHILEHIKPGDRIVYHGNYTGYGEHSIACINEILAFRRMVLAMPGMVPDDFVYLRGQQEQIWEKLLQLQFAPDPVNVLLWMLGNGLTNTLYDYDISPHDGIEACKGGIMQITKWTNSIRKALRSQPGHEIFMTQMKRMAFTDQDGPYPMLFVHAGLKPCHSLHDQGDHLWWSPEEFESINQAYKPFEKVVRGFDPDHGGLNLNCITATVDDGCGFGGKLVSVGFEPDGSASHILEA